MSTSAGSASDLARWPNLIEFLTSLKWGDGSRRVSGTVLVFVDDGRMKCCLSDRDQGLVAFAVAGSILELFDAAEGLVARSDADWRPMRKGGHARK
jgi:hypothetical protein